MFTALRRLAAQTHGAGLRAPALRSFCAAAGDVAKEGKKITVLFGTQTGNSEVFARQLAKEARKKHGFDCKLVDLYEYNPVCSDRCRTDYLILVITG